MRRGTQRIVLAVLAACALASALLVVLYRRRPGEPEWMTAALQPVPHDQNAYFVLERMMAESIDGEEETRLLGAFDVAEEGSDEWTRAAEQYVALYQPVLAHLDDFLARPGFVAPPPPAEGRDYIHRRSLCQGIGRALMLDADLERAHGDAAGAMHLAGRLLEFGCILYGGVDGSSVTTSGAAALWRAFYVLERASASCGNADVIARSMPAPSLDAKLGQGYVRAMAGELRAWRSECEAIELSRSAAVRYDFNGQRTWGSVADYADVLVQASDAYQLVTEFAVVPAGQRSIQLGALRLPDSQGPLLAGAACSFMHGLYPEHFRLLTALRLCRISMALRCYELTHGTVPETLEALAPEFLDEVPGDPFTEKPLVYEPGADPPRVLSVGPDQERDAEGEEGGGDDIAVELRLTPKTSTAETAENAKDGRTQ
jgi:hypothetical protein